MRQMRVFGGQDSADGSEEEDRGAQRFTARAILVVEGGVEMLSVLTTSDMDLKSLQRVASRQLMNVGDE